MDSMVELKLILVPYIVAAIFGDEKKYCKGLLIINEDNTSEIVVSKCDSFPHIVLIIFHELVHLVIYRLISNLVVRNRIDDRLDKKYLRY